MKVVDDILDRVSAGYVVALVGVDISTAFDMVSHATLLTRLEGVTGQDKFIIILEEFLHAVVGCYCVPSECLSRLSYRA